MTLKGLKQMEKESIVFEIKITPKIWSYISHFGHFFKEELNSEKLKDILNRSMNFPDRYGNKSRNVKIEIKEIDRECKKREFCKAMKCDALEFLENPDKTEEEKQIIERL